MRPISHSISSSPWNEIQFYLLSLTKESSSVDIIKSLIITFSNSIFLYRCISSIATDLISLLTDYSFSYKSPVSSAF